MSASTIPPSTSRIGYETRKSGTTASSPAAIASRARSSSASWAPIVTDVLWQERCSELARLAVALEDRLVRCPRGDRVADHLDADATLAQDVVEAVLRPAAGDHHDPVRLHGRHAVGRIDVDERHLAPVDAGRKQIGLDGDTGLVQLLPHPEV